MKLELLHLDVCGPIKPEYNGGNRYFITFTYDFSINILIYFMHEKVGAFEIFKRLKALMAKESGHNIQCLRIDISMNSHLQHSMIFIVFRGSKGIDYNLHSTTKWSVRNKQKY